MAISSSKPILKDAKDRGWIIVHPLFPLGYRHFIDPHQQRERVVWINLPWFICPVPLNLEQLALHQWDSSVVDSTGHVLWRASQKLSEYLINISCSLRKSLTILELGCGACAVPSLTAALCGHRVIATDLKKILTSAQSNIDFNVSSFKDLDIPPPPWYDNTRRLDTQPQQPQQHRDKYDILLMELPWGKSISEELEWEKDVDVILGSDILYALPGQPEFFNQLAQTLETFLVKPEARAIFAYQQRSGVERRFFEETLADRFVSQDVTEAVGTISLDDKIRVVEVRKKIVISAALLNSGD